MHVKFMSPEQILANQKNAQKSTGPKTPEGKERCAATPSNTACSPGAS